MRGLLFKVYLETRWPVLCFGVGLACIMAVLTWVLPTILADIEQVFKTIPIIKPLITALLGVNPDSQFSAQMTQAFLWVHPTVLSIVWAHEIMYCTRSPAGEIDRGTIDFLLGLPVSRWKLHCAETAGWLISGVVITGIGILGHVLIAQRFAANMQPSIPVVLIILCNLMSMYIAVGALAMLVSAMSDHRNRAMGVVFAILLVSFLLNFLAQFWEPAQPWARLSVLEYYRPAGIIQTSAMPWSNIAVLLSVGLFFWIAAALILRRRSICTV
jgi:ABC-type transport system involved in multi-copper enzyme maturation permease subunit